MPKEDMPLVGVRLPKPMIAKIDSLIESGLYPSRSEVLRDSFRRMYLTHEKEGTSMHPLAHSLGERPSAKEVEAAKRELFKNLKV